MESQETLIFRGEAGKRVNKENQKGVDREVEDEERVGS